MSLPVEVEVAIVGGGQAGLSLSRLLVEDGVSHVVLERDRIGQAWRTARWDSFCLVTPNWQCRLPHFPYAAGDPDGFMQRDEIVAYLEAFAASFVPPLHEGVTVSRVAAGSHGGYDVATSAGDLRARSVVLAIGGYHVPKRPTFSERFPSTLAQLHSSAYRNAGALPPGDVLVVGTGQSGCQIAEDLHLAGRRVHLCTGSAPRVARRYRGRDVVAWLDRMGYYDVPVERHPLGAGVRRNANHYVTGRGGGRDIDLRQFAAHGMQLYGRLLDLREDTLSFGDDLRENLDRADEVSEGIKRSIDAFIERESMVAPVDPAYVPPWEPDVTVRFKSLRDMNLGAVVWALGFAANYQFVDVPIFDGKGYPVHQRGVTSAPNLYVLGLPWLHTWGSGRFSGIANDADYLVTRIRASQQPAVARAEPREQVSAAQ